LPRLGDHIHQHFLRTLIEKDMRLKPAHLECFTLIGGCAGKIKRIAELQIVSISAVQQLAKDLEEWTYVKMEKDRGLLLTKAGEQLLAGAIAADTVLEKKWMKQLGQPGFDDFCNNLAVLYQALALPEKMLGQQDRVAAIAARLKQQLDADDLQRLASLLQG